MSPTVAHVSAQGTDRQRSFAMDGYRRCAFDESLLGRMRPVAPVVKTKFIKDRAVLERGLQFHGT
jgi:hypothetical protein